MSWFRPTPKPLPIPPYQPPVRQEHAKPQEEGIVVEETDLSATGMFRLFPWKKPNP